MRRSTFDWLIGIALLFGASPAAAQDAADRLIVPGQRAGAIAMATKPADLPRLYGAASLKHGKNDGPDEDVFEGIKVFAGTADEFRVLLTRDRRQISHLRFERPNGTWRTAEGIRVGLTPAELEQIIGGPFRLYGFHWQYGGLVTLHDNPGRRLPKGLVIAFTPQKPASQADEAEVSGDRLIDSQHPALERVDARIGVIILNFRDRTWGAVN
jgi:hypothetical protein